MEQIATLAYGKVTKRAVRVAVFGKESILVDREDILVATEYPNLARRVFKRAKIRFSRGSTEVKVAYGKYDYGVGVVETGDSLRENGLACVKTILESPAVLLAKKSSTELEHFGQLLEAGLRAEQYCLLKMNATADSMPQLVATLPAMSSLTVNALANGEIAIEAAVCKNQAADLIIRLKILGATGIIAQDVNLVM